MAWTSLQITRKNGDQPKLIALGGKGVGKSAFLRLFFTCVILSTTKSSINRFIIKYMANKCKKGKKKATCHLNHLCTSLFSNAIFEF